MNLRLLLSCATLAACLAGAAAAQPVPTRSTGQTLYLPVYSNIAHGEPEARGELPRVLMSVLVSIRNTDPARALRVMSAAYFDTQGRRVRDHVPQPREVPPMGTLELFIPRSDDSGGSGANFVIVWRSDVPMNPPLVEAVHANLPAGRSIVFVTTARPIAVD
ncbi:MAG: DUF3124 domain-containing protein [Burkholderiales bacterium]|nr:DUF3124 domain-containing protein [Burkholderiales bacterium]